MHTEHVDILLPEYLRGTLDSAQAVRVEEHVHSCAVCREELESLRGTFAVLDNTRSKDVYPAYFSSILPRVRQRLDRREKRAWVSSPFVNRFLLPLGVAAVLAVVVWRLPILTEPSGNENTLQAALNAATADDIADLLREDATPQDASSLNTSILTGALSDEQFVQRELLNEALNSETTSPFNVFADVTPQQVLSDLKEPDAERVLERLEKMETP